VKISALRTTLVDLPLRRPLVARVGSYSQMPILLLDLETDEGRSGQAYLIAFRRDWARAIEALLYGLFEELRGQDPRETTRHYRRMLQVSTMAGKRGLAIFALSGLDCACWDLAAKSADLPLWRYLGGASAPVPAYASEGLWLTDDMDRLAEEARELVAEGFRAVKMRLGRAEEADDVRAAEAIRAAIGSEVRLMADANQGWEVDYALRVGRRLEAVGIDLTWFEEPVPHDDVAGQARIARELTTPLATGENAYLPHGFQELFAAGAVDVPMPDLERIGGVTGWLRTAALAEAWRLPLSSHLFPEVSCHLLAASPTAYYLEHMPWAQPLLAEPLELVDGCVKLPERPGAGLVWDQDAVERWRVRD
jgi:mandelate racemase